MYKLIKAVKVSEKTVKDSKKSRKVGRKLPLFTGLYWSYQSYRFTVTDFTIKMLLSATFMVAQW
jgi:hypothetical protein